jgi:hypothetical protein
MVKNFFFSTSSRSSLWPIQRVPEQEPGETVFRSVESYDLQEILAMTEGYLQRLGDTDTDCIKRSGVSAVLQPYHHNMQERRHKRSKQPSTLILKGTLKTSYLIQRRQKIIRQTLPIHGQLIPLIGTAYIRVYGLLQSTCDINQCM